MEHLTDAHVYGILFVVIAGIGLIFHTGPDEDGYDRYDPSTRNRKWRRR